MKRISKITICIFILVLILQKLYNRQSFSKAKTAKHPILITSASSSCQYETSEIIYTLPDCNSYKFGSFLKIISTSELVSSRADTLFDSGFLNKKRLIVETIQLKHDIWLSPEIWVGYIFLKFQGKKDTLTNQFLGLLGNDSSYLIGRLSLGSNQVSSDRLDHLFKVTGMQYLASISGYHLNLIVRFFTNPFRKYFGKKLIGFAAILVSLIYIWFVGPKIPLVRAFLMLLFTVVSNSFLFRQTKPIYILFLVALVLIYNDISIITKVSFQLSFIATTSIIIFTNKIKNSKLASLHISDFGKNDNKKTDKSSIYYSIRNYIIESIKISIYVQISLIPLVIYHFQEFSLISLVVSVALTWLVPGLIILGILAFFISLLEGNGIITELFNLPVIFLSKLFLQILNLFDNEIFIIKIADLAWWYVPIWWLIVLITLMFLRKKPPILSLVDCLAADLKGTK